MKKLSGTEKIGNLLKKYPQILETLVDLGINKVDGEKTLVEAARGARVPLQIVLNNLAKAAGLEVQWPKIAGQIGKDMFSASANLRSGRPAGIKWIVAVHSGKGGVGKTMIATGLSIFFSQKGLKVGLLDLDIDCPNVPKILALKGKLITNAQKKIVPLQFGELKIISMAGIQEREDLAIMWRGPILAKAIEQMVHDTEWGNLDLLVIDLPPGTGDVPLTVFNMLKPDIALIVTTPQPTAITDAAKAIDMCNGLNIKVAGVLQNMAGAVFGEVDKSDLEKQLGVKMLGKIELMAKYNQPEFWNKKFDIDLQKLFSGMEKNLFS